MPPAGGCHARWPCCATRSSRTPGRNTTTFRCEARTLGALPPRNGDTRLEVRLSADQYLQDFLPGWFSAWPLGPCAFLYSDTEPLGFSDFGFLDSLLFRICPFAIDSSSG